MKAITTTIHGELSGGIQTTPIEDGVRIIALGQPKHESHPQPFVSLDPTDPPDVDGQGFFYDGELVEITRPNRLTGFLGYFIRRSKVEDSSGLLVCASTHGWRGSGITARDRDDNSMPIAIKSSGFYDRNDRYNTIWAEGLHTLAVGETLILEKNKAAIGKNRGVAVVNIGGTPSLTTVNQLKHANVARRRR